MTDRTIVFIDTETDGLDPYARQAWEFACIRRVPGEGDTRAEFFIDIDITDSDPVALEIGGYDRRHPMDSDLAVSPRMAAATIDGLTAGVTIVGAQPHFDTITLERLIRSHGWKPSWHYRLVDVESLAAGYLRRTDLGGLAGCAAALGITIPAGKAHTAMGDAETARAIYDRVLGGH